MDSHACIDLPAATSRLDDIGLLAILRGATPEFTVGRTESSSQFDGHFRHLSLPEHGHAHHVSRPLVAQNRLQVGHGRDGLAIKSHNDIGRGTVNRFKDQRTRAATTDGRTTEDAAFTRAAFIEDRDARNLRRRLLPN